MNYNKYFDAVATPKPELTKEEKREKFLEAVSYEATQIDSLKYDLVQDDYRTDMLETFKADPVLQGLYQNAVNAEIEMNKRLLVVAEYCREKMKDVK